MSELSLAAAQFTTGSQFEQRDNYARLASKTLFAFSQLTPREYRLGAAEKNLGESKDGHSEMGRDL